MIEYASGPLCPGLYELLRREFGDVTIANEGEEVVIGSKRWNALDGRTEWDIIQPGEYYRVNCFAPETSVATPAGDRPIRELVGTSTLLIPNAKGLGSWKEVEVRSFGRQRLRTIHLRRGRARKSIRATPEHRWVVSGRIGLYRTVITRELAPGDKLASCHARTLASYGAKAPQISAVGVMQGFTFGDGSHELEPGNPAQVSLFGHKEAALSPYFAASRSISIRVKGKPVTRVVDLPRSWKSLPPIDESLSFLLGWFAGYFAADGNVAKSGKQATIYSANPANLQFVKGLCYRLGVRTGLILPCRGKNEGCVPGAGDMPLYSLSLRVRDLPVEFWLLQHHRGYVSRRELQQPQLRHWTVQAVEDLGEEDDVYCAVVPGVEKFTLADNIMTHNCPYCGDGRQRLWFHYCYGQKDEDGYSANWLVNCYNEGCLSGRDRRAIENRQDLEIRLFTAEMSAGERNQLLATRPGRKDDGPPAVVEMPGKVSYLHELHPDHEAVRYIEDRGYDAARLGRKYGLCYCHRAFEFSQIQGRLIIPIEVDHQLVGWQARYVGDLDWSACGVRKYYNLPGMKKRKMLYNWDRASQCRVVVVVEGVTGVWTVGDSGTALLGKSITTHQMDRLAQLTTFDDRPRCLVLMLDPDADEDYKERRRLDLAFGRLAASYGKTGGAAVRVRLPKGKDPGDFDHETIWEQIYAAGDAMGVDVAGFT